MKISFSNEKEIKKLIGENFVNFFMDSREKVINGVYMLHDSLTTLVKNHNVVIFGGLLFRAVRSLQKTNNLQQIDVADYLKEYLKKDGDIDLLVNVSEFEDIHDQIDDLYIRDPHYMLVKEVRSKQEIKHGNTYLPSVVEDLAKKYDITNYKGTLKNEIPSKRYYYEVDLSVVKNEYNEAFLCNPKYSIESLILGKNGLGVCMKSDRCPSIQTVFSHIIQQKLVIITSDNFNDIKEGRADKFMKRTLKYVAMGFSIDLDNKFTCEFVLELMIKFLHKRSFDIYTDFKDHFKLFIGLFKNLWGTSYVHAFETPKLKKRFLKNLAMFSLKYGCHEWYLEWIKQNGFIEEYETIILHGKTHKGFLIIYKPDIFCLHFPPDKNIEISKDYDTRRKEYNDPTDIINTSIRFGSAKVFDLYMKVFSKSFIRNLQNSYSTKDFICGQTFRKKFSHIFLPKLVNDYGFEVEYTKDDFGKYSDIKPGSIQLLYEIGAIKKETIVQIMQFLSLDTLEWIRREKIVGYYELCGLLIKLCKNGHYGHHRDEKFEKFLKNIVPIMIGIYNDELYPKNSVSFKRISCKKEKVFKTSIILDKRKDKSSGSALDLTE